MKSNKETFAIGDYEQEQGTDDEADVVIQDPKAMTMQDVELVDNTLDSVDTLSIQEEPAQVKFSVVPTSTYRRIHRYKFEIFVLELDQIKKNFGKNFYSFP